METLCKGSTLNIWWLIWNTQSFELNFETDYKDYFISSPLLSLVKCLKLANKLTALPCGSSVGAALMSRAGTRTYPHSLLLGSFLFIFRYHLIHKIFKSFVYTSHQVIITWLHIVRAFISSMIRLLLELSCWLSCLLDCSEILVTHLPIPHISWHSEPKSQCWSV